ncbi:Hypothetical predicted protein [Paramuricea clavata]|uniref:UMOD/GP2/OIT3-like D8C domain-containing protein n=1 Tax=Paramuricea clavata TaxID=317549 RepID=A0A6S7J4P5_PARCT|nr:Hypothetical predicted protein [Paramuricea clavata]
MLLGLLTANKHLQKLFRKDKKVPALAWKDIISNHSVPSEIDCAFNCGNEPICAGFKYKFGTLNSPSVNCQLSNTTGKNNMANYDDQGWVFFIDDTKKMKHYSHTCTTEKEMTTTPGIPTTKKEMTTTPGIPTTKKEITTTPDIPTTKKEITTTPDIPTTKKEMTTTPGIPTTKKEMTTTPSIPTTVLPQHSECSGYSWLKESSRNQKYRQPQHNCDDGLSGWYRFGEGAGIKMASSCVPWRSCGTNGPGWMNGAHPTVADRNVTRKVCYTRKDDCCSRSNNIEVVNCGQYYVYKLSPPPLCNYRYCGSDN